jgi:serine/threonine-protein kinase
MEYLEGTDLGGLVRQRGPLPPEEAIDYVLQACHAVAEAHAHGIIHRDLKPANLFLTRRPDGGPLVKVLDFGIAKIVGVEGAPDLTATSQYMGSPSYMSPEQVRSAKRVDARTDLWALGVILYELLSGAPPFDGESTGDVFVKISTEPPRPFMPPIPMPGIEAVILRCLEKDPEQRFRDVGELAAALLPFAGAGGRARAEAVARIIGRELPLPPPAPVPVAFAAPAPPMFAPVPPTVTTLGLSAGQSQGAPARLGKGVTIVAVAIVVLALAATWSYLKLAPDTASVTPSAASRPSSGRVPATAPPAPPSPTAPSSTPPSPAAAPDVPSVGVPAAPAVPATETAAPVDAGVDAATRKPPKIRPPGRHPDAHDSDFVEDRR